jgi:RNA polymerase-binding transcription factor DksA
MAKKTKDKKKDKKSKSPVKPSKKTSKVVAKPAKSSAAKAKPAKKINKAKPAPVRSAGTKPATKLSKSSAPKKPIKLVSKQKPAPKKVAAKPVKKASPAKPVAKEIPKTKKPAGKPIDAVIKKGKNKTITKPLSKKKSKDEDDDDEDIPAEKEEDEEDVEVKDDYEKNDEEDVAIVDSALDEAGLIDLEGGGPPEIDEDDDEIPEKRGRGRRKKNEGKSSGGSMEAYIRNRPLQIDINKPLIKKGNVAAPKPFINTEDTRTRYSDKELAEFKELILEKLKEAQTDYDLLKQTLSNEDNHGTDDTSPSFKLLEDGSDVMSKEETAQLASRQEKYIVNLKNALVRIENKAYGICRVTGKLIPKERLRSVPHATLGIDAKLGQSK